MGKAEYIVLEDEYYGSSESESQRSGQYGAFRLGEWIVEHDLNRLRRGDELVKLSSLSMDILTHLARAPGRVVGSDELVRELWGGRIVSDNPVYKIIAKLRRALCDDAEQPRYIETVRKRGYRLVAPISSLEMVGGELPAKPGFRRRTEPHIRTLRVLPIRAIGTLGDGTGFCDGLAEEIRIQLGTVNDVSVVGPGSEEQDADLNVLTAVRMTTKRARVTVRLIRTTDGVQLWAKAYERQTADGVEGQVSVARDVAREVGKIQ